MSSPNFTEDTPLPNLYLQIQYADSPLEVLGLTSLPDSESDLRDIYRALALRIHPDKAPHGLRELHTSLFQKLHAAYDTLATSLSHDQETLPASTVKQLPETEASLHYRNAVFKEALRDARARVVAAKHVAKRAEDARFAAQLTGTIAQTEAALPGKGKNNTKSSQSRRRDPKATSVEDFDASALSTSDIDRSWDQNLLSGGGSGSVSFALKKEKEGNAAARLLEKQKLLGARSTRFDEADADYFAESQDTAERQADGAHDRVQKDVADTHLLKESERERRAKQDMVWDMGSGAW